MFILYICFIFYPILFCIIVDKSLLYTIYSFWMCILYITVYKIMSTTYVPNSICLVLVLVCICYFICSCVLSVYIVYVYCLRE